MRLSQRDHCLLDPAPHDITMRCFASLGLEGALEVKRRQARDRRHVDQLEVTAEVGVGVILRARHTSRKPASGELAYIREA